MTGFYEAMGIRLYLYSDENLILNTGRRSTRDPPPGHSKLPLTIWREIIDCLTGGKFWDWSKYRGDSAEFSAEV
ncbi:F-box family protein with DUF295 [Prunus dulcis]|uniref:F-box family protein with DUF295 n=1 Tax=Prunus dulcis TaxID=3755 RepID=A0A5H2XGI4_PRUDU|nr:F-box family protein with DUF295 [Prunus dulcis]